MQGFRRLHVVDNGRSNLQIPGDEHTDASTDLLAGCLLAPLTMAQAAGLQSMPGRLYDIGDIACI
ncbi:MAG: hypothetical protein U5P41_16265 [Gammaproteobacteria bacterium]|nr:hypothetical protein [Gammaproteobacteria bacterium]